MPPAMRVFERRISKFMAKPPTVRTAATVIVWATAIIVVGSAFLMTIVDRSEVPSFWTGVWWATQTVTTVGYGDVSISHVGGRIMGIIVMLWGTAFLSILVATITSSFVTRAQLEHEEAGGEAPGPEPAATGHDEIVARLERIERHLAELTRR